MTIGFEKEKNIKAGLITAVICLLLFCIFFFLKGTIIWGVAIPMAICNAVGGLLGAKLAIAKGNQFIRVFFLLVIGATILRFGYDVFFK